MMNSTIVRIQEFGDTVLDLFLSAVCCFGFARSFCSAAWGEGSSSTVESIRAAGPGEQAIRWWRRSTFPFGFRYE
jgi:hypothetical protein